MRIRSQGRFDPGEAAPTDFAWRVIGLVNLYRLLVACGLFAASRSQGLQEIIGIERPAQLAVVSVAWLFAGIGLIALRRLPVVGVRLLALSHVLVDATAIGFVLWASSGVESGLGILVLLPVAAMAMLVSHRDALFMGASPTVAVLVQQLARELAPGSDSGGYVPAGVLGVVILPRGAAAAPAHPAPDTERGAVAAAGSGPRESRATVAVHRRQAAREPAGGR